MIAKPEVNPLTQIKGLFNRVKDATVGQKPVTQDTAQDLVVRSAANVTTIKETISQAETDYHNTITRLKGQLAEAEDLFETATKIEGATTVIEQFKNDPESVTKDALYTAMTVLKSHM